MEINIPKKYKHDIKTIHAAKVGNRTTITVLELFSGFEIIGTSQIKDPKGYDKELGVEYALEEAYEKLEGFRIYYQQQMEHEVKEFMSLPNEPVKKENTHQFTFDLSKLDVDIEKAIKGLNDILKGLGDEKNDRK